MKLSRKFWINFGAGAAISLALVLGALAMIHPDFWQPAKPLGGDFQYDHPEKFRTVDASIEAYRQTSAFDVKMNRPVAIAAAGDQIYVAGDYDVKVFRDGRLVREFATVGSPRAIAVDGSTLFLAMPDHVAVLDSADRKIVNGPSFGTRANLTSIAVAGNDVYVADAGRRLVIRCDRQGNALAEIGKADPSKGIQGFVLPSPHFDLAMAPDGLLRVVNSGRHRVEAYTSAGDMEFCWGAAGMNVEAFSGCCNPAAIAIFADGRIATAEKGELATIKIYSPDGHNGGGQMLCVVAGPSHFAELTQQVDAAMDIAVAGERLLVLDPAQRKVRVFEPKAAASRPAAAEGVGHE